MGKRFVQVEVEAQKEAEIVSQREQEKLREDYDWMSILQKRRLHGGGSPIRYVILR